MGKAARNESSVTPHSTKQFEKEVLMLSYKYRHHLSIYWFLLHCEAPSNRVGTKTEAMLRFPAAFGPKLIIGMGKNRIEICQRHVEKTQSKTCVVSSSLRLECSVCRKVAAKAHSLHQKSNPKAPNQHVQLTRLSLHTTAAQHS